MWLCLWALDRLDSTYAGMALCNVHCTTGLERGLWVMSYDVMLIELKHLRYRIWLYIMCLWLWMSLRYGLIVYSLTMHYGLIWINMFPTKSPFCECFNGFNCMVSVHIVHIDCTNPYFILYYECKFWSWIIVIS